MCIKLLAVTLVLALGCTGCATQTGFQLNAVGPNATRLARLIAPAEVVVQGALCSGADVDQRSLGANAYEANGRIRGAQLHVSQTCTHVWY